MTFFRNHLNISLALILGLGGLLTACDKTPTTAEKPNASSSSVTATATNTNTANSYSVYVLPSYPPYSLLDDKGNLTGFNPEIINEIAKRQGIAINLIPQPLNTMFENIEKSDNALIVSGIARSPEREVKYELSNTYGYGQDTIAVKADNTTVTKFEDLKNVKVGVQAGSASAQDIINLQGKNNPNTVINKTSFLSMQNLAQGSVDAVLDDKGLLQYYAKAMPDTKIKYITQGDYFKPYEMVMVAKKGNRAIIDKVNTGLAQIVADGTYAKIYEKWFGTAPTPEQIPHSVATATSTTTTTVTTSSVSAPN